jgi:hypothetical protein
MLGEAWQAMGANRLRTFLTMLGMVIGVGSVVLMMAIGQGAQYAVAQTISTMGSNLYIVILRLDQRRRPAQRRRRRPTLTVADAEAIAELDGVATWRRCSWGTQQLVYGPNNWTRRWSARRRPTSMRAPGRSSAVTLWRFRRARGDPGGADRPDRGREPVRERRSARQDDPHPPESFRDHRRARRPRARTSTAATRTTP